MHIPHRTDVCKCSQTNSVESTKLFSVAFFLRHCIKLYTNTVIQTAKAAKGSPLMTWYTTKKTREKKVTNYRVCSYTWAGREIDVCGIICAFGTIRRTIEFTIIISFVSTVCTRLPNRKGPKWTTSEIKVDVCGGTSGKKEIHLLL